MFCNKENPRDINLPSVEKAIIEFLEKKWINYSLCVEDMFFQICDNTEDILSGNIPFLKIEVPSFDFVKSEEFINFLKKKKKRLC